MFNSIQKRIKQKNSGFSVRISVNVGLASMGEWVRWRWYRKCGILPKYYNFDLILHFDQLKYDRCWYISIRGNACHNHRLFQFKRGPLFNFYLSSCKPLRWNSNSKNFVIFCNIWKETNLGAFTLHALSSSPNRWIWINQKIHLLNKMWSVKIFSNIQNISFRNHTTS